MKNKKSNSTSLFLRELKDFFYQPKHERNGFILLEMGLMAMLANRMDMRNEFLFFMLVVVPIVFLITSIFIYRDKKRDIEKIKNYVDDEEEWEDDGLPFKKTMLLHCSFFSDNSNSFTITKNHNLRLHLFFNHKTLFKL